MDSLHKNFEHLTSDELVQILIDDCEGRCNLTSEELIHLMKILEDRSPPYTPTKRHREIFLSIYGKRYPELLENPDLL